MALAKYSGHRAAFTLLEIAIVIVIVGLLVAAIMASQNMRRGSQLQKMMSQMQGYASATQQFRGKFNALPGDMVDATRVWGRAEIGDINVNCGDPNVTHGGVGIGTCSGNGDGVVSDGGAAWTAVGNDIRESFRVWEHLALGGFIAGKFTGVSGTGDYDEAIVDEDNPDYNSPASALANTGFYVNSYGVITDTLHATNFTGDYNNVIIFGGAAANDPPVAPALTTAEAEAVDRKLDDGFPAFGKVATYKDIAAQPNCVTSSTAADSMYLLSYTSGPACMLFFLDQLIPKSSS